MRILVFILFSFCGLSALGSDYTLDLYCQDLNIILQKIEIHNLNIANKNTTRTKEGGAYKRKIFKNCKNGVCEVISDKYATMLVYDPNHPDAGEKGYVTAPAFSILDEMSLLIKAQRAYDVVLANAPFVTKDMIIGNKLDDCFKKYKYFKKHFDLRTFLGR